MRIYRIAMANSSTNSKKTIEVEATSCIEAGGIARKLLGPEGFNLIECCVCIA